MAKKYKKLKDEEILAAVKANLDNGTGIWDSKLSKERRMVLDYYHAVLPAPRHTGNSKYISQDVYDAVESTKASLLETFSGGYDILQFAPQGEEDVREARVASLYTSYVIHRQNPGYQIFSDTIHDGLLARIGVVKTYWHECIDEVKETFENQPVEAMDQLIAQDDVELEDYVVNEDDTVSGTIVRKVDRSQVKIEVIPPEEFLISATAKKLDKNTFVAHRLLKTASELLKMGLDQDKIDNIPEEHIDMFNQEKSARSQDLTSEFGSGRQTVQEQQKLIRVHECYIPLDVEGEGYLQLWKVVVAGDYIIDKQEVDRHPFQFFVPLPIPHEFFGSNFAAKVLPTQNARTTLVRGILDHTVITNNPRTIVVKGSLVNPKEMLENRVGGVVNVNRPDGIFPYPQTSLNPFVFQTIQLLDEDKEDTTGISKLSQGLNKDAVSNQNSQGLVENLVGLSQQRQKIIARNFAQGFLVPLYLEVYRLVLENEKKQNIVDLAGDWVEVNPSTWAERKDVFTTLKLGYGEQAKESTMLLQLHQLLSSDPSVGPMYPPDKKYNLLRTMIEKEGFKNTSEFLVKPGTPEYQPPGPDPKMMAEVEALKAKTAEAQAKMQVMQMESQFNMKLKEAEHELEKKQIMIDMLTTQREQERKEWETKSRAAVAEREIRIMETSTPEKVSQSNIVSPNS